MSRRSLLPGSVILGITLLTSATALAGGFEIGENTARAVARGGTGVVHTADPSAVYFNPALLPNAPERQILLSSNFLDLQLQFQRADLVTPNESRSFEPVANQSGIFPAPFLAASVDLGIENLAIGAAVFGPPAYGNPCYGEIVDGDCLPVRESAARGMINETDLLVVFGAVGAGYRFDLTQDRAVSLGLTAALARMDTSFSVNANSIPGSEAGRENPNDEAIVRALNLTDLKPTAILGISFQDGPLRVAASYRPPIRWTGSGRAEVDFPNALQGLQPTLTDEGITLETWHAGSLRMGWGIQLGEHPGLQDRPRFDLEVNAVWENWSLVDNFRIDLAGDVEFRGLPPDADGRYETQPLATVYQAKGYQDTWSLRMGASYGVHRLVTAHAGGFLETPAQSRAYTSVDFVSWERYAPTAGLSLHLPAGLNLDLAYALIFSPDREVATGTGQVYNPIPMSECRGPDFQASACSPRGTPPGHPQNEGSWQSRTQIFSAALSWQF